MILTFFDNGWDVHARSLMNRGRRMTGPSPLAHARSYGAMVVDWNKAQSNVKQKYFNELCWSLGGETDTLCDDVRRSRATCAKWTLRHILYKGVPATHGIPASLVTVRDYSSSPISVALAALSSLVNTSNQIHCTHPFGALDYSTTEWLPI